MAPAGVPPAPVFTMANREALCRSRASKNEGSGPIGANAMMADTPSRSEASCFDKPSRALDMRMRTAPRTDGQPAEQSAQARGPLRPPGTVQGACEALEADLAGVEDQWGLGFLDLIT